MDQMTFATLLFCSYGRHASKELSHLFTSDESSLPRHPLVIVHVVSDRL